MEAAQQDGVKWRATMHVDKYDPETVADAAARHGIVPAEVTREHLAGLVPDDAADADGNLLTTAGLDNLTKVLTGTGQAFTATRAGIGVGSTVTAALAGDTTLGANNTAGNGTVGSYYQVVDSAPTQANGLMTFVSTFTAISANAFAWAEWCIFTATATITGVQASASITGFIMANHKIQALGTKVSGAVWVMTCTIQLS